MDKSETQQEYNQKFSVQEIFELKEFCISNSNELQTGLSNTN